jgi:hypothetical protein
MPVLRRLTPCIISSSSAPLARHFFLCLDYTVRNFSLIAVPLAADNPKGKSKRG